MSTKSEREAARARALASLAAISDEEDAALTRAAEADPDNPPLTDADWGDMRPAEEIMPDVVRRARGQRGPGRKPAKVQVALRLDAEVVEAWRETGTGWQTRMGDALKRAIGR